MRDRTEDNILEESVGDLTLDLVKMVEISIVGIFHFTNVTKASPTDSAGSLYDASFDVRIVREVPSILTS
jgi:hypothetical protein